MARFTQFHDPELSIWQAAVGEVEAQAAAGGQGEDVGAPRVAAGRPDDMSSMAAEASAYCRQVDTGAPLTAATAVHPATEGLLQTAGFCSLTALKLAKAKILGNQADAQRYKEELAQFGDCDPRYSEAAAKYAEYFVAQQKEIPYIVYKNLGDLDRKSVV